MRHIIGLIISFIPITAFADPGHGAPTLHAHSWEVLGWAAVGIAVVWLVARQVSQKVK